MTSCHSSLSIANPYNPGLAPIDPHPETRPGGPETSDPRRWTPDAVLRSSVPSASIAFNLSGRLVEAIPELKRYAMLLARNRADADDLLQATLERALAKLKLYQPTAPPIAWLRAIMRNLFLDHRRHLRYVERAASDDLDEAWMPWMPANQEDHRLLDEITHLIDALPRKSRDVLTLVVLEGNSCRAAAMRLHLSTRAVRSHLFRARSALRKQVATIPGVRASHDVTPP